MSLEARGLTFRYPRRGKGPVLERVNLTLEPGERAGPHRPQRPGQDYLVQAAGGVRAAHSGGRSCWTASPCPSTVGPAQSR